MTDVSPSAEPEQVENENDVLIDYEEVSEPTLAAVVEEPSSPKRSRSADPAEEGTSPLSLSLSPY